MMAQSPHDIGVRSRYAAAVLAALVAFSLPATLLAAAPPRPPRSGPRIEFDTVSQFSHIRVRRTGNVRMLIFVRDNGDEAQESILNLQKPHELLEPYSRYMFASYLFQPQPERVLIVGLGGAAMVHFVTHYDPQVKVDAVEIDPAVVKVADEYFDCRTRDNVTIVTADGVKYLQEAETQYDVIYLDAFLKPSSGTDSAGVPLEMKTQQFYASMQDKLRPDGMAVFNLNRHRQTDADVAAIRKAFGQVYVFRLNTPNYVAVATREATRKTPAELRDRAREIDQRFKATFSFQDLVKHLMP